VPVALACGLAGEVVRTYGELRLRVFGTSMAPSILPGDLISVQRAGLREISPGEIVLFLQQGRLFVHRVVRSVDTPPEPFAAQGEPCLITRGDRLGHNDPPVSSSEFLGRVTSVERGTRRIACPTQPSGWQRVLVRLLQTSDYATYLYVRLATVWGRFLDWTFGSDTLAVNVGAKAPTHNPNVAPESITDAGKAVGHTERVFECGL